MGGVVDRGAAVGEQPVDRVLERAARGRRHPGERLHQRRLVGEATSATRSRGDSCVEERAAGPACACASLSSSPIEPDVSSTSTMSAGLRSSCHSSRIRASTFGSGSDRRRVGCAGSTPFAAVRLPASGTVAVGRAEAGRHHLATARSGDVRYVDDLLRARLLVGRHPRGVEHDQRVVGEERPLLRVDRDEALAALAQARRCSRRASSPPSPRPTRRPGRARRAARAKNSVVSP